MGTNLLLHSTTKGTSIRNCAKSTVNIVAYEGSGMARTSKSAIWSTSREGRSMLGVRLRASFDRGRRSWLSLRRARISTGGIRLNSRRAGRAAHVSSSRVRRIRAPHTCRMALQTHEPAAAFLKWFAKLRPRAFVCRSSALSSCYNICARSKLNFVIG